MDISSIDALNLSLIDQYVKGDPNPEFENSMMDTLKWLYSKGCGWVNDHNLYIAENLELLKWLYENGCPLDPIVCVSYAALMCNTKSLKWLHAKNFSFDAWTYRWVVKTKELQSCGIQPPSIDSQIATLDCLKDLGCPYIKEVLLLEAPLHERIIMWMKEYK